jgi:tripartite ATP-independent transporter DctP family solute receptor
MKKFVLVLISVISIVVFCLVFASVAQESKGEPVKIIFSEATTPIEASVQACFIFEEEAERLSGGTIVVDFYHSGQLVSQTDQQVACMDGGIDMTLTSIQWIAEFMPELAVLGTPFNFRDGEHGYKFWNESEVGKELIEKIAEETNTRILGSYLYGTRQITTTEKAGPVRSPADLKGKNFRMPGTPLWLAIGHSLGCDPTPVDSSEAYIALQTRVVVGVDMPLNQMISLKLYEPTKYTSLSNHLVSMLLPIINEDKWKSLTPQQQGWIKEAAMKMINTAHKSYVGAFEKDIAFLKDNGQIIIEDVDKDAFMEFSRNYFLAEGAEFSKNWDWDLFDRVQAVK